MTRVPGAALRPFVGRVWAVEAGAVPAVPRERVLPTGGMHLAFRVSDTPFRFLDDAGGAVGRPLGHAVVGGPRATPYFKDLASPSISVGAELLPGALEIMFGVPAIEVAGGHVSFDEIGDVGVSTLLEQLREAASPGRRLDVLEASLAARLSRPHALHVAVTHALRRFEAGAGVGEVVRETGYSHRRFLDLFLHGVGLRPKLFCRLWRFRRALVGLSSPQPSIASLAFDAGYSDQAHLNRDFRDFAGITPGEYRRLTPTRPGHVPLRSS